VIPDFAKLLERLAQMETLTEEGEQGSAARKTRDSACELTTPESAV
jgi:hypothetical protein